MDVRSTIRIILDLRRESTVSPSVDTITTPVPILIMDDVPGATENFSSELAERLRPWRPDIQTCSSAEEFDSSVASLIEDPDGEADFIIDMDMGPGRERERLVKIREVNELRKSRNLSYYIIALTSHSDLESDAYEAGADVFLRKAATQSIDALEVVTRIEFRSVNTIRWTDGSDICVPVTCAILPSRRPAFNVL